MLSKINLSFSPSTLSWLESDNKSAANIKSVDYYSSAGEIFYNFILPLKQSEEYRGYSNKKLIAELNRYIEARDREAEDNKAFLSEEDYTSIKRKLLLTKRISKKFEIVVDDISDSFFKAVPKCMENAAFFSFENLVSKTKEVIKLPITNSNGSSPSDGETRFVQLVRAVVKEQLEQGLEHNISTIDDIKKVKEKIVDFETKKERIKLDLERLNDTEIKESVNEKLDVGIDALSRKFVPLSRNGVVNESTFGTVQFTTLLQISKEIEALEAAKFEKDMGISHDIIEQELAKNPTMSEKQKAAVRHCCQSNSMLSIYEGYAGAGKTFVTNTIINLYKNKGYDVVGAAVAWDAANNLKAATGIQDAKSLATFIRQIKSDWAEQRKPFTKNTLIVVDEAGMVNTNDFYDLLTIARKSQQDHSIKFVVTGDTKQLKAIGAGSLLETLVKEVGSVVIDEIRRQNATSQREMVKFLAEGESGKAFYILENQECVHWGKDLEASKKQIVQDYLSFSIANPDKSSIILTSTNKELDDLNKMVRETRRRYGYLKGLEVLIECELPDEKNKNENKKKKEELYFAKGDKIVFRDKVSNFLLPIYKIPKTIDGQDIYSSDPRVLTKESQLKEEQVVNRTTGEIVFIERRKINGEEVKGYVFHIDVNINENEKGRIVLDTEALKSIPMTYDYARTINASQGRTVDKAFFLCNAPKNVNSLDLRVFYVALSRHKEDVGMYVPEKEWSLSIAQKNDPKRKYSKSDIYNHLSYLATNYSENLLALDEWLKYNKEERSENNFNPNGNNKSERERIKNSRIEKPENINLNDRLPRFAQIPFDVTMSEEVEHNFWGRLYYEEKISRKYLQFNKAEIQKVENSIREKDAQFTTFKNQVLISNGFSKDYQIKAGDRLFLSKNLNQYPIINLEVLTQKDREKPEAVKENSEISNKNTVKPLQDNLQENSSKEEQSYLTQDTPVVTNVASDNIGSKALYEIFGLKAVEQNLETNTENKVLGVTNEALKQTEREHVEQNKNVQKNSDGTFYTNPFSNTEKYIPYDGEGLGEIVFSENKDKLFVLNHQGLLEPGVNFSFNKFSKKADGISERDFFNYLNKTKNVLWEESKYGTVRFLAESTVSREHEQRKQLNSVGSLNGIISKYDENGKDVLGKNYPLKFSVGPDLKNNEEIHLVKDIPSQMFYFISEMNSFVEKSKRAENPNSVAKINDFVYCNDNMNEPELVKENLSKTFVFRYDEDFPEWAFEKAKYFEEKYSVQTIVKDINDNVLKLVGNNIEIEKPAQEDFANYAAEDVGNSFSESQENKHVSLTKEQIEYLKQMQQHIHNDSDLNNYLDLKEAMERGQAIFDSVSNKWEIFKGEDLHWQSTRQEDYEKDIVIWDNAVKEMPVDFSKEWDEYNQYIKNNTLHEEENASMYQAMESEIHYDDYYYDNGLDQQYDNVIQSSNVIISETEFSENSEKNEIGLDELKNASTNSWQTHPSYDRF